ncbi:MAG: hypothetical protein ACLTSG_09400 [Lachnospiraceae bacterium]
MLPELRLLDTIFGAACIPIALTVITAFAQLRRGKRSGRGMLVFAAVLFCIVRFAYDVALTAAFDLGSELLSSIGDWLIPVVLYAVFVQLIIRKNPAFNVGTGT